MVPYAMFSPARDAEHALRIGCSDWCSKDPVSAMCRAHRAAWRVAHEEPRRAASPRERRSALTRSRMRSA
jgi:hypothetical protein